MNEHNYDRLREALDRLPTYNSPGDNWDHIARALTPPLREQLPSYAPPPAVWNALSKELDAVPRSRLRRLPGRQLLAIAATLLLLLTTGFLLVNQDRGPVISYSYSQEAQPAEVVADWDDDEASFDRARQEVRTRNEPRLNNLGHELDELTYAREEVKSMLTAYGDDPGVVQQLAEIERERDDVYRRIIIEL
ncbi:hypothetical protein LEM8419_02707 [Neolewinella maritima]|uniref:DUF3379 domain-containing protein n=1 Tax=Neolewinella maritima TaxID=1383882 RepID=A0ABM9B4H2_9BACT|nr:hypothetical protein [Neolewinella maritima]CAH1001800.1 hypothetical protein LEM8419_02707 [Neolewinella maritima]